MSDPSRDWIQSWTGEPIPLRDPQPEQMRIADIAHHLSQINRFTGATLRPYSVAQHSVYVARRAGGWDGQGYARLPEARFGLLHDSPEAFVGDVSSPLKALLCADFVATLSEIEAALGKAATPEVMMRIDEILRRRMPDYKKLEEGFMVAIALRFNLEVSDAIEAAVRRADLEALSAEHRDMMVESKRPWIGLLEAPREPITPLIARQAECLFLREFDRLFPEEGGAR